MEIEIKAKIKDAKKIEKKLQEIGAILKTIENQLDIYYNSPIKDITKLKEYIRLRKKKGKIIFGYHINKKDCTEEKEVEINDLKTFQKILSLTGFKKLGIIDKCRKKFQYKEFNICIDDVKDIGLFIEIETEGKEVEVEEKKSKCLNVLDELGIPRSDLSNVWLCDIATGKQSIGGARK